MSSHVEFKLFPLQKEKNTRTVDYNQVYYYAEDTRSLTLRSPGRGSSAETYLVDDCCSTMGQLLALDWNVSQQNATRQFAHRNFHDLYLTTCGPFTTIKHLTTIVSNRHSKSKEKKEKMSKRKLLELIIRSRIL